MGAQGMVKTEIRYNSKTNIQSSTVNSHKLENSEELKRATVSKSLSKAIQTARTAKKLSQKELATKINEKPAVIMEYENGKAIPNAQVINKLERKLGVKFPRPGKVTKVNDTSGNVNKMKDIKVIGGKSGVGNKKLLGNLTRGGPPKRR